MANKGRVLTAVAAVATSAALLLSGTFAWQSISQRALNEASDVINPGGRLHDDFNGENKDVYVENFAEEPIYARIRLGEYFEIIANYGKEGVESSTQVLGSKNDDDTYNYDPFYFDGNVDGDGVVTAGSGYWSWQTGGETVYMPTFNMNKDSLAADINGNYVDAIGGISNRDGNQYENYVEYADGEELAGTEIYDADSNDIEDDGTVEVAATHTAKPTGNATLISMAEWDGMAGPYWVYDTDGWVYWAQAIEPDTATGLLLDGIALNQVMDDTWYYAIEVVAQFVTADDVGKADNTGFYADGNAPTAEAEALLAAIGVDMSGEAGEDEPESDATMTAELALVEDYHGEMTEGALTWDEGRKAYVYSGDANEVFIRAENFADLDGAPLSGGSLYHSFKLTGIITEERENVGNARYWYCDSDGNQIIESRIGDSHEFAVFYRDRFSGEQAFYTTVQYTVDGFTYESDPLKIIIEGKLELANLILTADGGNEVTIRHSESVTIGAEDDGADLSAVRVDGNAWTEDSDWTYNPDTKTLYLGGSDSYYDISDNTGSYSGRVNLYYEDDGGDDDVSFYLDYDHVDETVYMSAADFAQGGTGVAFVMYDNETGEAVSAEEAEWQAESLSDDYAFTGVEDENGAYHVTLDKSADELLDDQEFYVAITASRSDGSTVTENVNVRIGEAPPLRLYCDYDTIEMRRTVSGWASYDGEKYPDAEISAQSLYVNGEPLADYEGYFWWDSEMYEFYISLENVQNGEIEAGDVLTARMALTGSDGVVIGTADCTLTVVAAPPQILLDGASADYVKAGQSYELSVNGETEGWTFELFDGTEAYGSISGTTLTAGSESDSWLSIRATHTDGTTVELEWLTVAVPNYSFYFSDENGQGIGSIGTETTTVADYEISLSWIGAGEVIDLKDTATFTDGSDQPIDDPVAWANELDTESFAMHTLKVWVEGECVLEKNVRVYDSTKHSYSYNSASSSSPYEYGIYYHYDETGNSAGACVIRDDEVFPKYFETADAGRNYSVPVEEYDSMPTCPYCETAGN